MGLDAVEIVLWAEKEFEITIADAEAGEVSIIGDFCQLIFKQLVLKNGLKNTISEEVIYNKIKQMLIKQYAVKGNIISRHAKFIQDLRLE